MGEEEEALEEGGQVGGVPRIDPPIQTLCLRSGGEMTLTREPDGARRIISLKRRSARPRNIVVPPHTTIFPYLYQVVG